ncbi:MAG TPA: Crp/Fnr family transcriptional regulator, partial [Chitinophagales bacterium]|nr:Crp/Fnr family transcriptional regulator [Chitinophagales bacterium]
PSSENIELLEDSVLQGISFDNLQLLYKKYPELERIGRLVAEHHYNSLAAQTHRLRFYTSAERYNYFYKSKFELVQRVPLGIIASYLGMTLENLSRIRSK